MVLVLMWLRVFIVNTIYSFLLKRKKVLLLMLTRRKMLECPRLVVLNPRMIIGETGDV